ncbi:M56 family metallopeptidase [Neobacillus sp.]|uniref:M56 family metallopeptidase n=1 Tax=Neobacillus sp. TaxID=2675273 RepID=UPI002897F93E|nr:M56 family metallopeptidase [Neobacillus sp.]
MINTFVNIYLPRFFDWVIETSIMASILVGLILCVKALLRNKLNPRWHYLLWMILIVRLLLPWSPDSSYSIYSILSHSYETTVSVQSPPVSSSENERMYEKKGISGAEIIIEDERNAAVKLQTTNESKKETIRNENQKDEPISFHTIALYIWLTGVIILGFVTYLVNRSLTHYIKQQPVITDKRIVEIFENCKKSMSVEQCIPLILAGKISSPTVHGFFRPRVLLSSAYINQLTEQQLRHIFYHELAHIKRRDVGLNWLMHSLLILNWFNPILWHAYSRMREDQELACDVLALTFMDEKEQISYGHTIISLLEYYSNSYQVPSLANLSKNKRTLKRRILMIKKFQKKSYRWSALGVIAVIAVSSLSLLNGHADGLNEKQKEQTTITVKEEKKQSSVSIQTIVEQMVGTQEQAKAELGIDEILYKQILNEIAVAQKFLTTDEFEQYISLDRVLLTLDGKAEALRNHGQGYNPDLLSGDEQTKLKESAHAIGPLRDKVTSHFIYTKEEAQKLVDFPIKRPTYTPEGYSLKKEDIRSEETIGKPQPIISTEYRKGEFGYYISQSLDLEQEQFSFDDYDKIENYMLEGNHVTFGYIPHSNVKSMKMFVPAKGKNSAYQIFITDAVLNKTELEKIMISLLK